WLRLNYRPFRRSNASYRRSTSAEAGPLTIQHRSLVTQRHELNQSCAAAKPASQPGPLGRGQSGPAYGPPLLDRLQTLLGMAFWQGQRSGTSKKLKKDSHY